METKGVPTPARVYQDFQPSNEWVHEDDLDTLLVYLPGFAKEQLKVQLRARNLIISGERKLSQNTWSRFRSEFPVSTNCDLNKISAKFEGNILFVKQPKLITPTQKPEVEKPSIVTAPASTPQKPVEEPNVAQKEARETPTLPSQPNMENKEARKDKDQVPKTGLEEKSGKTQEKALEPKSTKDVSQNASEKKTSDQENKNKKVMYGELDKATKTASENYKRAVGMFAAKLKTSTNAVNWIVVLLIGLVIAIYVSGSIKSWNKA